MTLTQKLYDEARARLAASGFTSDVQTKIALFVGAAKGVNAAIMAPIELQPQITAAFPFVHGQYFRELEFVSLLARVTRWSPNAAIYVEGARIALALWAEWLRLSTPAPPATYAVAAYGGLALGHALLARVRLEPVIGNATSDFDPFVVAIRRIEQEGGRMIQTQIRLLKDGASPLSIAERERIIDAEQAIVDDAFARFLEWIAAPGTGPVPASPTSLEEAAANTKPVRMLHAGSRGSSVQTGEAVAARQSVRTGGEHNA